MLIAKICFLILLCTKLLQTCLHKYIQKSICAILNLPFCHLLFQFENARSNKFTKIKFKRGQSNNMFRIQKSSSGVHHELGLQGRI